VVFACVCGVCVRACVRVMCIKELTEINQETSKSLPLVLRHDHYAGDVVLLLAKLFLGEGGNRSSMSELC